RIEASVRNLVEAVKSGRATETLLAALSGEEDRLRVIRREVADLDGQARTVVSLDVKRTAAQLAERARAVRGLLERHTPETRRLLQRVLHGTRIACEPFDEAGRRGYRFRAT